MFDNTGNRYTTYSFSCWAIDHAAYLCFNYIKYTYVSHAYIYFHICNVIAVIKVQKLKRSTVKF